MRIKSYAAETVAAALKRVRTEMGADAFLLKTRSLLNPLGFEEVEVIACAEEEKSMQAFSKKDESNRMDRKPKNAPTLMESAAPKRAKANLTGVHERLAAIEGQLSALISQMAEKLSN